MKAGIAIIRNVPCINLHPRLTSIICFFKLFKSNLSPRISTLLTCLIRIIKIVLNHSSKERGIPVIITLKKVRSKETNIHLTSTISHHVTPF